MILDWMTDPKIPELQTVDYQNQQLQIEKHSEGNFIGRKRGIDHNFYGSTPEEVEKQLIEFM